MTLAIAISGFLVAVLSFAWQVWTHLTSGPRVSVSVSNSIVPDARAPYDWLVCVTATNKGRAAATVANWGFRIPGGGNVHQLERLPWSAQLPYRLEPQSSVDLHMPVAGLRQTCAEEQVDMSSLKAWIRLGTGREVVGGPPKVQV